MYYEWIYPEGEDSGEPLPTEVSPDPEPSAVGEGGGSGELPEEAAPGYTENETTEEDPEEETQEVNQYGLVEVDYSDSFTAISDQLNEVITIGYAVSFMIAAYVLIALIIRLLRN